MCFVFFIFVYMYISHSGFAALHKQLNVIQPSWSTQRSSIPYVSIFDYFSKHSAVKFLCQLYISFYFFTSSHRKCNFIIIITYQVTFLIGEFIHLFFQLQVLLCQVFHHLFSSECSINLSSYTTTFMKDKQTPPKILYLTFYTAIYII